MSWPHCMCAVSIARSEYYVEGRGSTVVDGRWQCEGIEKLIAAAVGGKRRVLLEEGARSHDGRGGLACWAIVDPPLAEYHSVFILGDDER